MRSTYGRGVAEMTREELAELAHDRERMAGVFDELAATNAKGWGDWYREKAEEARIDATTAWERLEAMGQG